MALDKTKAIQLYNSLMDAMISALDPRHDPETGQLIPTPAALMKEVREFLKDNDVYTMTSADADKAQSLLDKARDLGIDFEPGVYHA